MAAAPTEVLYTPEELLTLRDGDRYELLDGRLVEKRMGAKAGRIAAMISYLLQQYAAAQNAGLVFSSDCGYQIFPGRPNRVRFPDVSFIARGRLPNDEAPDGHVRIVPELAVEVISPSDLALDLDAKIEDYSQANVPLIWVVYPNTRRIMVYRRGGQCSRLTISDQLSGEDVLPGFACRVEEVFAGA